MAGGQGDRKNGKALKMNSPLFSCVIPVKGLRSYFHKAMASLQNQGVDDALEIIVQDGDVESDAGQSDALNKGFAKARGEWLFWLNADDVLLPGALRKVKDLIDRMERKGPVEWIAGNTVYIDRHDKVIGTRCDARWRPWFGKYMSVWTGGPSAFFRRELWEERGGLDVGLRFVMDLDLWTRWAREGIRFESVDDYLWGFRVHESSTTCNSANKSDMSREYQMFLRRYNLRHEQFWRNVARMVGVFDGTRLRKARDAAHLRDRSLSVCATMFE